MDKPVFDPSVYEVRKVGSEDEFGVVVDLERRIYAEKPELMAPEDVMRERFSIYPGAFVIYHQGEPVGFRTYAPVKDLLLEDVAKGVPIFPILQARYVSNVPTSYFNMLSMGVLEEHRVSRLRDKFQPVRDYPSRQLLRAAFLEAKRSGGEYILAIPATDVVSKIFTRSLGFKKFATTYNEGESWDLTRFPLSEDDLFKKLLDDLQS